MNAERHELALAKLREVISSGATEADGRLPPERMLAANFGIGRRCLRRALDVLETEGCIRRRRGRGTYVISEAPLPTDPFRRALELTNPIEILEVRLAIEPVLARLAAYRASRCDIEKLNELAETTGTAPTAEAYERADAAFHRRVAEAARNTLFLAMFDAAVAAVSTEGWRQAREHGHCVKNKAVFSAFHKEIAKAIAARDGGRAEDVMFAHLSEVQQKLFAATALRGNGDGRASLEPEGDR